MSMRFGLRVPTIGKPQDTGAYAAEVEAAGLDFMWTPDTPLLAGLWRDVYMHLTCAALRTSRLRLGPGVTNPLTRHPLTTASAIATLDDVSGGRADLVVGTGYSSAYIIGRTAASLASMREATALWRGIFSGRRTQLGGLEIETRPAYPRLPVYLAATGPKMLQLAGEVADGVLIFVGAAPGAVAWALEQVEVGAARAGRQPGDVKRMLVLTTCVDADRGRAIDRMRPAAAALCRHRHANLLFERAGLPPPPTRPAGLRDPYPDLGHAMDWEEAKRVSAHVPDAAVEAMVALGSGAEVAERARVLIGLGLDAIWFRHEGTWERPDALLQALAGEVLPRLRG
jgi:5,10-methylenetetrahydromethanopterin reductase